MSDELLPYYEREVKYLQALGQEFAQRHPQLAGRLKFGANDFGSVMMEENVVSSAGTTFRLNAAQIESLIRGAGYEPRRRNNWYQLLN